MTNSEEKIEAVESQFADRHLLAIRLNSLFHAREFVVLKKSYISIVRKKLA
jgi:hypothetical protein